MPTDADYTPSVAEIRSAYVYTDDGLDFKRIALLRGEAFDRWLAQHEAQLLAKFGITSSVEGLEK